MLCDVCGYDRDLGCGCSPWQPCEQCGQYTCICYATIQPPPERLQDPDTGGIKETKLCQMGALDAKALWAVGEVGGFGAKKYERYNFAKGFAWSWSYDALQRHLMLFWDGDNYDKESGLPHLAHAAWHCLCLLTFMLRNRGKDDRLQ